MFHSISPAMLERMKYLEARDAQDRDDGAPHHPRSVTVHAGARVER